MNQTSKKLKIAMIAPPWIEIPPRGYGGIEHVINYLIIELRKLGCHVELFSVGDSTVETDGSHAYYEHGQYAHIAKSLYNVVSLPATQILFSLQKIRQSNFDVIHDHNGIIGPAIYSQTDHDLPPILHTLHGPLVSPDAYGLMDLYPFLGYNERLWFNGISKSQISQAPGELKTRMVDVVYNAVNVADYPLGKVKDDYFITLGRFARDKGQATAAKVCRELGLSLKMGGVVADISDPKRLEEELNKDHSSYNNLTDFRYYRHSIVPLLDPPQIEYCGIIDRDFISRARGLLFAIDWEEPFGLAVIEALACGTPVVAMARGALPEIIEHGRNGFLAKNEGEFKTYIKHINEIDPAECRKSVKEKFSGQAMAQAYLDRYNQIIAKD